MKQATCQACHQSFVYDSRKVNSSGTVLCPHCFSPVPTGDGPRVKSLDKYLPSTAKPPDVRQTIAPPASPSGSTVRAATTGVPNYSAGNPSSQGRKNQSNNPAVLWVAIAGFSTMAIAALVVVAIAIGLRSNDNSRAVAETEKPSAEVPAKSISSTGMDATNSATVPQPAAIENSSAANSNVVNSGSPASVSTSPPIQPNAPIQPTPANKPTNIRDDAKSAFEKPASTPQPKETELDDPELERIRKKIEAGKPTREDIVKLASMEVNPQHRTAIATALHDWIKKLPTMDDVVTLAVIRWADAQTETVLSDKLGNTPGLDPAFFYALVCVGGQRTQKELASLDYVSRADYPLMQRGQPEWVLFPEKFAAQAECEKLERFFTDQLLESRHGPVRYMGCLGCQLCGRGYCLQRLGDMSENDIALDVKDLARKTWELVSARQRSARRN